MVDLAMVAGRCRQAMLATGLVVLYGLFGLLNSGLVYGQQGGNLQKIRSLEDSLAKLGYTMYNEPSEPERLDANFTFVKTLVSALKEPYSYRFPFDSLDMVSILSAPDESFRIFSWHLQLNDGSYLYYGTIQLNTSDGSLKMYPLLDKTYEIAEPEQAIMATDNWYGAQYYQMVPLNGAYALLGWKGHTPYVTQKVIEVLRLTKNGAQLGQAIFDTEAGGTQTRAIYRYNRNVSMHLEYDSVENRIVFDHLAPADPRQPEQYEQYGPDLSYDAWQLENGRLVFVADVPLMNPPHPNDSRFNDPAKPQHHPKSGLNIQ
ncbi:hypothetical protein [Parapedobacter sp.]